MTQSQRHSAMELEQRHRMQRVWAVARPQAGEVGAAYRRWLAGKGGRESTPHFRGFRSAWLLVAATCLVGGGAFAFNGVFYPDVRMRQNAAAAAPSSATGRSLSGQGQAKGQTSAEISRQDVNEPASAAPAPVTVPRVPVAREVKPASVASSVQVSGSVGSWSRVAEAMRRGDDTRVSKALEDLSRSADAATRDAARLTRAQLEIAAGDVDRVRPVLSQLAGSGATPLIRNRAREMLQRISK
jgi:hypothetical protein